MSKIVLFTGGARSGKSTRAEQYAGRLGRPVLYLAAAEVYLLVCGIPVEIRSLEVAWARAG